MGVRPMLTGLLLIAVLAAAGCRTRLPVVDIHETGGTQVAAFPDDGATSETRSTDPLRPFLDDVETDRLQDMVRMDRFSDSRRGLLDFLSVGVCVCVPGRDH